MHTLGSIHTCVECLWSFFRLLISFIKEFLLTFQAGVFFFFWPTESKVIAEKCMKNVMYFSGAPIEDYWKQNTQLKTERSSCTFFKQQYQTSSNAAFRCARESLDIMEIHCVQR
ncbi:hypothetical protein AB205_0203480 [Aquarana catesbeiana]|uniref:Uncharacterized protein n=1 Tax=Aquarana catesbeiana TaxID=8400 RepID=A0A2G9R8G1_AQUCT|nr:hypothetical protein AB205_0203480 [Aquarana catesbeiana]